ncbi:MAG TPA: metabolite traffic protein EboE [Cytophagales bacterium]|nr:metabolite traffic protein EboE [Cytophagales bacterium]
MKIKGYGHLTYCTNIHPGETWLEVFKSLNDYVLPIKEKVSPSQPFGIGLRLSNAASLDLIKGENLRAFKSWLDEKQLYVFTMNGFPYGGFHGERVKDKVHYPDWTSQERLAYTLRLAKILAYILPEDLEGGISTSPISYKPWIEEEKESRERIMNLACRHFFQLLEELIKIKENTGRTIHIDIEPEPDGLLEDSEELAEFFKFYLIPDGKEYLKHKLAVSSADAKSLIKNHIRACYDVCHHALAYENPSEVFKKYEEVGIKIGKIQISAGLKVFLKDREQRKEVLGKLKLFEESTYLHQVLERKGNKKSKQYPDLPQALNNILETEGEEWRVHFHVPLFVDNYDLLQSTQTDIIEVLNLHKKNLLTSHLEVETYTWDVLPTDLKLNLKESIQREMEWVIKQLS